jgi:hypothetical protein
MECERAIIDGSTIPNERAIFVGSTISDERAIFDGSTISYERANCMALLRRKSVQNQSLRLGS